MYVFFIIETFVIQMIISDSNKNTLCTSTGYSVDITISNTFMDADNNWHKFKFLSIIGFVTVMLNIYWFQVFLESVKLYYLGQVLGEN
jgi:hypothetical protein